MKHAAPTRREMGVRTAFNLLGPLTNPAGATRQVVGVPRAELTDLLARSLLLLGSVRAWVVHGADGIDEISTTGHTKVVRVPRRRRAHVLHPPVGLRHSQGGAQRTCSGGDAAENAAIVRRVLDGETGAPRDVVVLNAGAALFVAGRVASVRDGHPRRRARRSIPARRARRSTRWFAASQAEAVA